MTAFTDAQRRALLWLPEDGAWKNASNAEPLTRSGLDRLFGPYAALRRGEEWRLTKAGIAARKEIA